MLNKRQCLTARRARETKRLFLGKIKGKDGCWGVGVSGADQEGEADV